MFITNTAFRSPVSNLFGGSSETYWLAAELAAQHPWFLVTVHQLESADDDSIAISRTILISDVITLEQFVRANSGSLVSIGSVQLITPGHINGSDQWQMDKLRAVWTAEEPSTTGQTTDVFETAAGRKYAYSMLGTSVDDLQLGTVRFRST